MALTDIFRPKYKHSDAQVRAQAVKQMGADEADLLAKIAENDKDPEVRRLAVERIDDAEFLVDLVANEQSPSVRRQAHQRAAQLWSRAVLAGTREEAIEVISRLAMLDDQSHLAEVVQKAEDAELRELALGRITDERALAELARRGPDSAIRRTALEKIDDTDILRSIAMDESRKPLGIAAVDRIDDVEVLAVVATKAKNKHVRSRAQKRKSELSEADAPVVSSEEKRAHAERVQLAREVKGLVDTSDWVGAPEAVEAAAARWQELGDGNDVDLNAKFRRSVDKFAARFETVGKKALEAARQKLEEERERERAQAARAEQAEAAREAQVESSDDEDMTTDESAEGADSETEASPERDEFAHMSAADKAAARAAADEARQAVREQKLLANIARLEALCVELEAIATADRYKVADRKLSEVAKTFAGLRLPAGEQKDALSEHERAAQVSPPLE